MTIAQRKFFNKVTQGNYSKKIAQSKLDKAEYTKQLEKEEVIDRRTPVNNSLLTGVLRPIIPY